MFNSQAIIEIKKPKSPAKLKKAYEKKEAVLNKWRDGKKYINNFLLLLI